MGAFLSVHVGGEMGLQLYFLDILGPEDSTWLQVMLTSPRNLQLFTPYQDSIKFACTRPALGLGSLPMAEWSKLWGNFCTACVAQRLDQVAIARASAPTHA